MKRWICFSFIILASLVGCAKPNLRELPDKIKQSVVLITYGDTPGHGSGFFIEGEENVCTILTAAHVVKESRRILITTEDIRETPWKAETVQTFPNNLDLALITFSTPQEQCPYSALPLGNSNTLKVTDEVYIVGYPAREQEEVLEKQFSSVTVSTITPPYPDGYAISFTGTTAKGMSGGPVINSLGQVFAIHGKTDIVTQSNTVEKLSEKIAQPQTQTEHFKWAIPINLYKEKIVLLEEQNIRSNKAEKWYQIGNKFFNKQRYISAITAYNQALQLNSNFPEALVEKGLALENTDNLVAALSSITQATEINPTYFFAWLNRGRILGRLERHEDALACFNKALEIKSDSYKAWQSRGGVLAILEQYEEAKISLDKAVEINPKSYEAWFIRGSILIELQKYQDAMYSYERAIEIKPNSYEAWVYKGAVLHEKKEYTKALNSFNKAIEINSDSYNWSLD